MGVLVEQGPRVTQQKQDKEEAVAVVRIPVRAVQVMLVDSLAVVEEEAAEAQLLVALAALAALEW